MTWLYSYGQYPYVLYFNVQYFYDFEHTSIPNTSIESDRRIDQKIGKSRLHFNGSMLLPQVEV